MPIPDLPRLQKRGMCAGVFSCFLTCYPSNGSQVLSAGHTEDCFLATVRSNLGQVWSRKTTLQPQVDSVEPWADTHCQSWRENEHRRLLG